MKKRSILILLLISVISVNAQEKIKSVVSDEYNRNSLSIILISHDDDYKSAISEAFYRINRGEKFDWNKIDIKNLEGSYPRNVQTSTALRLNDFEKIVNSKNIGRQIVGYWHGRNEYGVMNDQIIKHRGKWNAKDQDLIDSKATKLGVEALGDMGFTLINNSYLLLVDFVNIKKIKDPTKKNNEEYVTLSAEGFLFKIVYGEDEENEFYTNMWVDSVSDPKIAEKIALFNEWNVDMKAVTSVSVLCSSSIVDGDISELIKKGYYSVIQQLENKVEGLKTTTAVYETKPIRAKIGAKESLKNKQKFNVYKYREDEKGELESVKVGIIRATKIVNNRTVTTGNSGMSEFYQIAGSKIEKGYTIQQKNDLGIGLGVGYRVGGKSGVNVQYDQLLKINTKGTSQYILTDIAVNGYLIDQEYSQHGKAVTAVALSIGAGVGFRPFRGLEFVPSLLVGAEFLGSDQDNELDEESGEYQISKHIAYYAMPALKVKVNLFYPLQAYVGANYAINIIEGITYSQNADILNNYIKGGEEKSRQGFGFNVGIKYNF